MTDAWSWQPIETCPVAGTVWIKGGRNETPTTTEADGDWWRSRAGHTSTPTAWAPVLTPAEVAARIVEARAQEREACAVIADEHHKSAKRGAAEEWGYSDSKATRARIEARAYEAAQIATAIRARKDSTP